MYPWRLIKGDYHPTWKILIFQRNLSCKIGRWTARIWGQKFGAAGHEIMALLCIEPSFISVDWLQTCLKPLDSLTMQIQFPSASDISTVSQKFRVLLIFLRYMAQWSNGCAPGLKAPRIHLVHFSDGLRRPRIQWFQSSFSRSKSNPN